MSVCRSSISGRRTLSSSTTSCRISARSSTRMRSSTAPTSPHSRAPGQRVAARRNASASPAASTRCASSDWSPRHLERGAAYARRRVLEAPGGSRRSRSPARRGRKQARLAPLRRADRAPRRARAVPRGALDGGRRGSRLLRACLRHRQHGIREQGAHWPAGALLTGDGRSGSAPARVDGLVSASPAEQT
jgi:hypothetical protein